MGMFRPAGMQGSRGKFKVFDRLAPAVELGVDGGLAGNTIRQFAAHGNRRLGVNC
jgi:hypothetical protein